MSASTANKLTFFVNGEKIVDSKVEPETTLLEYLRLKRGLTGTKLGCGEGGCGACTVTVSTFDKKSNEVQHRSVNACLAPVCSVDGQHVITIEGIGNTKKGLHPAQEKVACFHGSQCGFCTPGIVMALYTHLRKTKKPTEHGIEEAFDGNLCRCTGYRPIIDAAKTFATDIKVEQVKAKESADQKDEEGTGAFWERGPLSGFDGVEVMSNTHTKVACDRKKKAKAHQEIPFPEELKKHVPKSLEITGKKVTWFRPTSLEELCEITKKHPNTKIVVGNTEVGIEAKFKFCHYPFQASPVLIPEMNRLELRADCFTMGASVSLTSIQEFLTIMLEKLPQHQRDSPQAVLDQLRWFSSTQIRNVGCLGGNLVTASPISDLCPVFLATDSVLTFAKKGEDDKIAYRSLPIAKFFLNYRKVDLRPSEVLVSVSLPLTKSLEYVSAYKQARRREDDIAIVTSCIKFQLVKGISHAETKAKEEGTKIEPEGYEGYYIESARLGYGGVWKTPTRAKQTEDYLSGQPLTLATIQEAVGMLAKDFPLNVKTPGGMPEYRKTLCASFLYKFFIRLSKTLKIDALSEKEMSAIVPFVRPPSKGQQTFQVNPQQRQAIGKPVVHRSAKIQVSGEAIYIDDLAPKYKMLYAALVLSTVPHGEIVKIDASPALSIDGVEGYYDAKDLKGLNAVGHMGDEELFASNTVHCVGQVIGVVVAETHKLAVEAAKEVKIEYKQLPAILSIEDAVKAKSFLGEEGGYTLERGDLKKGFKDSEMVIEGEMRVGGQEHFYLETQCSEAIPG
ncbi:hypothetical protein AAMO2058_001758500, partial [Amorphochlora amoebiformis]